jgi:peptidylprolyl isomerase
VAGVKVAGAFGSPPAVAVSGSPPARPEVAVMVRGPGRPLRAGDLAIADDYGRTWKDGRVFENTYILGVPPDAFPVGSNALGRGLEGIPVGSRVVVVIPPAEGFGISAALPKGVSHNDTALLVVDLVGSYEPDQGPSGSFRSPGGGSLPIVSGPLDVQPIVKVPHRAPPKALVVKTLIEGNGPPIEPQQLVITQYVGVNWRTGAVFGSSWQNHVPTAYLLGSAEAIPAWEDALPGVRIGSRIEMVVPPADGYGSKGNAKAGIKGTDTLVFVVDVLGSYGT